MNSQSSIEWQLGALHGFPPMWGWTLLLIAAILGTALTFYFYRGTLRPLSQRQKLVFCFLRLGFFLFLLLCLAGPMRVERSPEEAADARPLALVVDDSASMTTPDARQVTRLSQALRVWKKVEPEATRAFGVPRVFSMGQGSTPVANLAAAIEKPSAENQTHLYESLAKIIEEAPRGGYAGVVCLTDGLDTTGERMEKLIDQAAQSRVPLYFASGENQHSARESLLVREVSLPGQVLRKSKFNLSAVIESRSKSDQDVPLALLQAGKIVAETKIHLRPGSNLLSWNTPVQAEEQGLLQMDLKLGDGPGAETIAVATRVFDKEPLNILFYQGSIDWGFRFINKALQRDKSFTVTSLFDPGVGLAPMQPAGSTAPPPKLPDTAEAFQPYQMVVLANVFAEQLSAAQQHALVEYVRGGGGLLFIVSDTEGAQTFAGADIESMLPVIFERPPAPGDSGEQALRNFQDMMKRVGGSKAEPETDFAAQAAGTSGLDPLQNFALPPGPKTSPVESLFGNETKGKEPRLPQFSSYAQVAGVKAGGKILAVHPVDKTKTQQPRALFVTQRFGQGQSAVLLTDALWRWKLSLPSDATEPELFWQQLFLALAQRERDGLKFTAQPFFSSLNQKVSFRIDGVAGKDSPTIVATYPSGTVLPIIALPGPIPRSWIFDLETKEPGKWRVRVTDARGSVMETLVRTTGVPGSEEMSDLPPDLEGMLRMAGATGGAMLAEGVPGSWNISSPSMPTALRQERAEPMWNSWPLLLLCLGFYVTELIWRRRAKLL